MGTAMRHERSERGTPAAAAGAQEPAKRRHGPGRLATRFLGGYLLAALLSGVVLWGVTGYVCGRLRTAGGARLAQLAATVAATVPAEEHEALTSSSDENGLPYQRLRARLSAIRQANRGLRSVYTLARLPGARTWTYVLDARPARSPLAHIGEPYRMSGAPELLLALEQPVWTRRVTSHLGERTFSAFAPIRDGSGRATAVAGLDAAEDEVLGPERQFAREAAVFYGLLLVAIAFAGRAHYQKRRAEVTRARNVEAQLALHRLAETVARSRGDVELLRGALDVIARGTGIRHWVLYQRAREPDRLVVAATRELPRGAEETLRPDPPAAGAASPASRAAWTREPVVCGESTANLPAWGRGEGPGERPIRACVPLVDGGETTAVLQCFVPRGRGFGTEDLALVRWMASQLAQGLKRRELERRDQLLASYMLRTGEILIGADAGGAVTYLNPAAERALGARSDELRGIPLDALVQPVESGTGASLVEAVQRDGTFTGELWCVRVDGSRFPVAVNVEAVQDAAPGRREIVLLARDVTEARERERQLRAQRAAVETLNDRLEHANERLREADRMKNEFIANTSHELRTPLNAVIGFATLLEQGVHNSSEERETFARWIRESAEHLLGIINDILDLAKIEAGRLQVVLEPGDAAEAIRSAVQTMRSAAARKSLGLAADLEAGPLPMLMDSARLRQVLLNLLGNAVKFTDTGEVRVRASRDPESARVVIHVEDTGIGIAREKQSLLFRKFSQVDGSYHRRHQGTGLGLAITRTLVERMKGTIEIESEGPGRGTRVTLTFPAYAPAAPSPSALEGEGDGPGDSAPVHDGSAVSDRTA